MPDPANYAAALRKSFEELRAAALGGAKPKAKAATPRARKPAKVAKTAAPAKKARPVAAKPKATAASRARKKEKA